MERRAGQKRGEFAAEFDAAHSVEPRGADGVGEPDRRAGDLRPFLIDAVERGMQRALEGIAGDQSSPRPLDPSLAAMHE